MDMCPFMHCTSRSREDLDLACARQEAERLRLENARMRGRLELLEERDQAREQELFDLREQIKARQSAIGRWPEACLHLAEADGLSADPEVASVSPRALAVRCRATARSGGLESLRTELRSGFLAPRRSISCRNQAFQAVSSRFRAA